MFGFANHSDGELIVGEPNVFNVFNLTSSSVTAFDQPADDIGYHLFDWTSPEIILLPFEKRFQYASDRVREFNAAGLSTYGRDIFHTIPHTLITNYEDLIEYEEDQLALGFEGIMMRNPLGKYKGGDGTPPNRATFKEGLIYKLKRFEDDEGLVVGFIEATDNINPDIRSNTGTSKRSKAAEGLIPAGTLGKFILDVRGKIANVPPGNFTHPERLAIWNEQDKYLNKAYVKFRHFPHGAKDTFRMARATGFRDPGDF
jgi:hypothetical protein